MRIFARMNPTLKNFIGPVTGLLMGALINIALIYLFLTIFPLPSGVELTEKSLSENIHRFEFKHFVAPFMGHAGGTLIGAWISSKIMVSNRWIGALIIGLFFLIGGFMEVSARPTPTWFAVVDLGLAYLPMAWLGFHWSKNE